jgi:ABC-type histidine transport system ATPase subunit
MARARDLLAKWASAAREQLSAPPLWRAAAAGRDCPRCTMRPDVILFDEPTSALDPELVGEVLMHPPAGAGETYHGYRYP